MGVKKMYKNKSIDNIIYLETRGKEKLYNYIIELIKKINYNIIDNKNLKLILTEYNGGYCIKVAGLNHFCGTLAELREYVTGIYTMILEIRYIKK